MKPEELDKLKELQKQLYLKEKEQKQLQEATAGTMRATASLLTSAELLDYHCNHIVAMAIETMTANFNRTTPNPNRMQRKQFEKSLKEAEKRVRDKNKKLTVLMRTLVETFERGSTFEQRTPLNVFMDDTLEQSISFYNELITFEKVRKVLNPSI